MGFLKERHGFSPVWGQERGFMEMLPGACDMALQGPLPSLDMVDRGSRIRPQPFPGPRN